MKQFLKKLFWWNDPARGAFFGMTLAGVGTYFILSIFHALWLSGVWGWLWLPLWDSSFIHWSFIMFPGLCLMLTGYALFLQLRFYHGFCRDWYAGTGLRNGLWYSLALFVLCAGIAVVSGGAPEIAGVIFAFLVWYLPLLLVSRTGVLLWFGQALAWSGGALIVNVVWTHLYATFCFFLTDDFFASSVIREIFGVSGSGWGWFFAAGLLLLAAGYLLTAGLLATAANRPFRRMFGKGVCILWILFGAACLTQLGFALAAAREGSRAEAALEERFGRPVTAAALSELFYGGQPPDAAFWKEFSGKCEALTAPDWIRYHFPGRHAALSPEAEVELRGFLEDNAIALKQLEEMTDLPLPKIDREFPSPLYSVLLPELNRLRWLSRVEFVKIRAALRSGDRASALAGIRRMKRLSDYMKDDVFLISGLVWATLENLRFDAMELLLESGADASVRAELDADCAAVERAADDVEERAFYSEAVTVSDAMEACAEGRDPESFREEQRSFGPVPLRPFRFFFPQFWLQCELDWIVCAEQFRAAGFLSMREWDRTKPYWFAQVYSSAFKRVGNKFLSLVARARAMRALIALEGYRSVRGDYPETPDFLPDDPFGGGPMRYRKGGCAVDGPNGGLEYIPAVQVWSVGPDGIDDGGLNSRTARDGRSPDDIRAILRLAPEGGSDGSAGTAPRP